jgi:four helix bundle protein
MGNGKLEEFKAYQKALELYDMVVHDISHSMQDRRLDRLVRQQLASADSICSNIEEGYGRESSIEYRRFLIIARGSLRERWVDTRDCATGFLKRSSISALNWQKKLTGCSAQQLKV